MAAAGNEPEFVSSPARSPLVIAIGALSSELRRTEYSAKGDVWAPGDQIVRWLGRWQPMQGTSFASPTVAAILVDYMSGKPEWEPERLDELSTLLEGSVLTAEGLPMPSGDRMALADPVPEKPMAERLMPHLILIGFGVLILLVGMLRARRRLVS